MKRILLLGLLFGLIIPSFGQTIIFKGFVKDAATLCPIKDVNISINGTKHGTTTDVSGFFSIKIINKQEKITFSHINYEIKELKYSEIYENFELYLNSKTYELKEFTISSDPIVNLTKALPIYIKDYVFVNNNICLLAYNRKKLNDIRLYYIDSKANILNELEIENANLLFKDCFGDVYYLNNEDAVKLSFLNDSISELNKIPREEFEISYKAIEFKIEDNIYFSTNHYQNFIKKYHYFNLFDNEREVHTIISIYDSTKIDEFERDFNFFFYAKNSSKIGISVTSVYNNLNLLREYQPIDWTDKNGRFSPIDVTVNNIKDSIYVFNYVKDNIEVYNLNGILNRKINSSFLKDEYFTGKIIVSFESNQIYALYKIGSIIQLREIDIINGRIKKTINIPSYPFIENIKLIGNQIYFLYKKKNNQELKQLYRMELV